MKVATEMYVYSVKAYNNRNNKNFFLYFESK